MVAAQGERVVPVRVLIRNKFIISVECHASLHRLQLKLLRCRIVDAIDKLRALTMHVQQLNFQVFKTAHSVKFWQFLAHYKIKDFIHKFRAQKSFFFESLCAKSGQFAHCAAAAQKGYMEAENDVQHTMLMHFCCL